MKEESSNTQRNDIIKARAEERVYEMATYEKSFKEEAIKLSDEIGIKKAAAQLGIPYYTLPIGGTSDTTTETGRTLEVVTSENPETRKISVSDSWSEKTPSWSEQTRFYRRRSVFSQRTERSKSSSAV